MKITSKAIATSGIIAALYIAMTLPLGGLATQPFFQIRPGEALMLLPIIMPSAILGLSIGCFIVNIITSSLLDAIIGTIITVIATIIARVIKKPYFAGIPIVILNAFGIPLIFIILGSSVGYWYSFFQILLSQTVWVYGLGLPLVYLVKRIIK